MEQLQRFTEKYVPEPNSGCWLWTAGVNKKGYGTFEQGRRSKGGKKTLLAHRYSYSKFCGEIPADLRVLHKCDIPCCVNPDHLFLGTDLDNSNDKIRKGRLGKRFGEYNGRAKLTNEDVVAIKSDSRKNVIIASEYGVSGAMIGYIKRGDHWRHL